MVMFDVAYNSEQPLMVSTVDTVMIMVKEVAHFQPVGSRCVPVGCSSSLKDPVHPYLLSFSSSSRAVINIHLFPHFSIFGIFVCFCAKEVQQSLSK